MKNFMKMDDTDLTIKQKLRVFQFFPLLLTAESLAGDYAEGKMRYNSYTNNLKFGILIKR